MASYPQPPPPRKNYLDNGKFTFTAPPLEGSRVPPKAKFGLWNNNPNISVYTGLGKGKDAWLRAGFDPGTFFCIIEFLSELGHELDPVKQKEKITMKFDTLNKDRSVKSSVYVGRKDTGVIYFSVIDPNNSAKIPFDITNTYFHTTDLLGDKTLDEAAKSRMMTRAWVRLLTHVMSNIFVQEYVYFNPNDKSGGSGGDRSNNNGGYNNNSSGGGGSDDDDLPF